MKIVEIYSHLNGEEYILAKQPVIYQEIKSVIAAVDACRCMTKTSKEKTMRGRKTWTPPEPMRLIDSDRCPGKVWPVCKVLDDGTLVLVYGRPGKHIIFDPSGTGTQWQGHVDLKLQLAAWWT
ncbi:MAG: hypothetical protein HY360_00255 [Verrucomicrobia bacterium]|nr:hypothetical protein [Verrucomicrobiota bacterium]